MSKHSKRTGTEKEISDKLFLFIKQWIRSIEGFREGSYTMQTIKLHILDRYIFLTKQNGQRPKFWSNCNQNMVMLSSQFYFKKLSIPKESNEKELDGFSWISKVL